MTTELAPATDVRDAVGSVASAAMFPIFLRTRTAAQRLASPLARDPEFLLYVGGFVLVVLTAAFTGEDPVRVWTPFALAGTGLGILLRTSERLLAPLDRLRRRHPSWVPAIVAMLITVVPLGYEAVRGIAEVEIGILQDGAERWLETGTPYPDARALADADDATDYNVYFPLLVLAGMPSVLLLPEILRESALTDPRWFLLLGSVLAVWFASRSRRAVAWFCALPPVGMVATAGMTDLLPVALLCAGLVLAGRGRPGSSGALVGLAAAAKLLAWPAVPVVFLAHRVRDGAAASARFAWTVAAVLVVGVALPAAVDPVAFWRNAVSLPLGFEPVTLVARTPFPGYVVAASGELGRIVVLLSILAAALGMLAWLVLRPPASVFAAAGRLTIGWTLLFVLAPATRVGYFVFPATVLAWLWPLRTELSALGGTQRHADRTDRVTR